MAKVPKYNAVQRAVLANRNSLIMRERSLDAEVERLLKPLAAEWERAIRGTLHRRTRDLTPTQIAEAVRRTGVMVQLRAVSDQYAKSVERAVGQVVRETFRSEAYRASHAASLGPEPVRLGVGFGGLNRGAVAAAARSPILTAKVARDLSGFSAATVTGLRRDLTRAVADGWSLSDLAEKWADGAGAGRAIAHAQTIARTAMMAASNQGQVFQWREEGVYRQLRWEATFDARTCFPGHVRVTTRRGLIPIRDVVIGDEVLTHRSRWRMVTKVLSREFSGPSAKISAGGASLISTWDHPIWVAGDGWIPAAGIRLGQSLAQHGLGGPVLDRGFADPDHAVPHAGHRGIPLPVAIADVGLRVPVVAVRLDHRAGARDQEVGIPLPDPDRLQELDADGLEDLGDGYFEARAALEPVVAGGGAVPLLRSGTDSELDATEEAGDDPRWAAAGLGAEDLPPIHVGGLRAVRNGELFPAPAADGMDGRVSLAGLRASREPGGHRSRNPEPLPAAAADLESLGLRDVALAGAESSPGLPSGQRFLASSAPSIHAGIVGSVTIGRLDSVVHCLVVEDDESFFAEGILVHNCPACGSRHGKVYDINNLPPLPFHYGCRCVWLPVFATDSERALRSLSPYKGAGPGAAAGRARSYEAWLGKQPAGVQMDILGSELKYQVWRDGDLTLAQLTNPDATTLTDAQVRRALGQLPP